MCVVIFLLFNDSIILPANEEKGLVKIHYVDNIGAAQEKIIRAFNKENSGKIEVIPVHLPFTKFTTNERKEILARSLRSKSEKMDIFAIDLIWGPRFTKWAVPLNNFFTETFLEKFWKHAIESCYFEDKLVAMPFYTDVGLMYYRKDLLMKMGISDRDLRKSITWDQFLKMGSRFKNTAYPFFVFAADNFEGMICSFHESLPVKNSKEIFGNERINLKNSGAYKSLQLMVDLIHKYKYSPREILEFDESKSRLFALENDAVFIRGWPGFFTNEPDIQPYRDKVKQYQAAPLPYWSGEQKNAVYGGWNLMISKYSKHREQALKFMKFMISEKSQQTLHSEGGYFPALKFKNIGDDSLEYKMITNLLQNGKHRPFRENYTNISDIMAYYLHKALKKEITVDEALTLATEKINSKQVFIK